MSKNSHTLKGKITENENLRLATFRLEGGGKKRTERKTETREVEGEIEENPEKPQEG